MNATNFINQCEHPVFFYASNGAPAGQSIAIWEETELPVDLDDLEGEVADGIFEASNLNDGSGAHGWQFRDFSSNTIYKIQIFDDAAVWNRQREEWEAAC